MSLQTHRATSYDTLRHATQNIQHTIYTHQGSLIEARIGMWVTARSPALSPRSVRPQGWLHLGARRGTAVSGPLRSPGLVATSLSLRPVSARTASRRVCLLCVRSLGTAPIQNPAATSWCPAEAPAGATPRPGTEPWGTDAQRPGKHPGASRTGLSWAGAPAAGARGPRVLAAPHHPTFPEREPRPPTGRPQPSGPLRLLPPAPGA